jgi:hypothetical protein
MGEGWTDRRLSKLLFEARELLSMYADHLDANHVPSTWPREVISGLDEYRVSRGWDPHGFGREDQ